MGVFRDTNELYRVMGALFERLQEDEAIAGQLGATGLILRFRWTDPDGEATIDLRGGVHFTLGPCELEPQVEMIQSADVAHRFWLGRLNVPTAIASRQVVARGSIAKALKLLPAIKPAFAVYRQLLGELGLGHLAAEAPRRRRRRRLLERFRRRGRLDTGRLALLSANPVPLMEGDGAAPVPAAAPPWPSGQAGRKVEMLRRMLLIRAFEEHLAAAWARGELPTEAIHLSIGQEAVAVGVCSVLGPDDTIATTHRGHGHMLARGAEVEGMMAEIYGKATGLCGGKGGSMHVTDASLGALGANGIVGASALLATGSALASRLGGDGGVAVAFFGDGATNQGMVHEALNFAAVFDLPVVFVVENNLYGEFTSLEHHTRVTRLADRAAAYGIPAMAVDGNDAVAVARAAEEAVTAARAGKGPVLLEARTYRYHGHMEGEEAAYRSVEEIETWRGKDPIPRLGRQLIEEGLLDEAGAAALEEAARRTVEESAARAAAAPEPSIEVLERDVFAPDPAGLWRGQEGPQEGPETTCSRALWEALAEEMRRDERVFLLGEDVSHGGYFSVTTGLAEEFPGRVLDTPISEYAIVGSAVGAAMRGLRPVAEILFSDFLTACMDPIVNQAAKLRYMSGGQYALPLVVRTPGGAGLGMAAQHSQSLEALLTGIPGLIVVAPSNPRDAKGLLKAAIRSANPVLFFENKLGYLETGPVPPGDWIVPLGRARVVHRGDDLTVVAVGGMVSTVLSAARTLEIEGIGVELIDPRTLVPLDLETIAASAARTRRLVTVEEAPRTHGFGAELVARVVEALGPQALRAVHRIGAREVPIPYARNLERAAIPGEDRIVEELRALMG